MTKDKWTEIVEKEMDKVVDKINPLNDDPGNWFAAKTAIMEMVAAVDNATEVYNKENN